MSGEEDLDNTFLECTTIHKWCSAFLAEHAQRPNVNNYKLRSALSTAIGKVKQQPEFSDLAIFDRPRSFFKEEIAIAIKGRLVNSLEDYLALDRSGRGTPLQERERRAVYAIYEHYQDQLDSENICDWEDFVVQSVRILEQNPELQGQYRSAVVDEIQDFSEAAMRLISLLVPQDKGNNLFLVGDGLQRIYRGGYALSHLGIEVVGRSHLLRKNYRNTEETLRSAHAMMEQIRFDDMDDGKKRSPRTHLLHQDRPSARVTSLQKRR